jgi:nucleoside-triphosphatase
MLVSLLWSYEEESQIMGKAFLLTGEPEVGKTGAIKKILDVVGREHCGGFYTEEIRVQETRVGFRLITLGGRNGILAHVDSQSPVRAGRYGVNLDCLESIGMTALYSAMATKKLVVLDEIGPMQLYSHTFKKALVTLLRSPQPLLGTIAVAVHPWLNTIKPPGTVELYVLTVANRNMMVETIISQLNFIR